MYTFSNSIGNISVPDYGNWVEEDIDQLSSHEYVSKKIVIYLIWISWVSNQVINLIILLNFLIAEITDVYTNVNAMKELIMYQ